MDVDDEITLDALITITDGNAFNNVDLYWGYNGAATNHSSFNFDGVSSVYLSQIVGGSPPPLSNHSGTDVWSIRIVGLNPGYYELDIDAIALIDLYIGTQIANNTGVGLPQVQPSDFDKFEYVYAEEEFCLNVVGSLEVTIDAIDDIETVTGAPVVVGFDVNYGNLSDENIDDSVMADALISFDGTLPATAKIIELKLGNTVIATDYSLANADEVLLSDVITSGPYPAPNQLNGHSDSQIDEWSVVFAGIDAPGTYTVTVQGIAYVGTYSPTNVDFCYSVTAEEEFTVTYKDLAVTATPPAAVCEGEAIDDSQFIVVYPDITNNSLDVLTDAKITLSVGNSVATTINWEYSDSNSGSASGNYNLAAGETEVYLSDIVAGSPTPLLGHNLLTVAWDFEFIGLEPGQYIVTVEPIAILDGDEYALIHNDMPLQQILFVYPKYEPVITGDTPVYSGSTTTYSIIPQDIFDVVFNEESWVFTLSLIHISEPTRPY